MFSKRFNPPSKYLCQQPPEDTVSHLRFSPGRGPHGGMMLAASSWDQTLRVWEIMHDTSQTDVAQRFQDKPISLFKLESPVLATAWIAEAQLASAGADGKVVTHDLASGQSNPIGKHDAAVSKVAFDSENGLIVSCSWDKSCRFWDGRQPNPVHTAQTDVKLLDCDINGPAFVCIGEKKTINIMDLKMPNNECFKPTSKLKMCLRRVRISPDRNTFVVGGVEGRMEHLNFERGKQNDNFTFKAHRVGSGSDANQKCYPVHAIDFSPTEEVGMTVGGDGHPLFWNYKTRSLIGATTSSNTSAAVPLTACAVAPDGLAAAVASGYDWIQGYEKAKSFEAPKVSLIKVDPPKKTGAYGGFGMRR